MMLLRYPYIENYFIRTRMKLAFGRFLGIMTKSYVHLLVGAVQSL